MFRFVIPCTFSALALLTLFTAKNVQERIPQPPLEKKVNIDFWGGIFGVLKNKYLLINTVVGLIDALGNGMLRVSVLTSNPQLSYAISQALENYIPTEFYNYRPGVFTVITYDNAELPTSPLSNNSVRNAIIGFVAGAVISAIAVWLYSAFDTVIRDKKKIEDYFDVSVIGVIPSPCEKCVNTEVQ
jgi:capsular polysaccharide biosynthesis protein